VAKRMFRPRQRRVQSIVFHINEVGIKAIPIISLMAFAIAFVMGYQGAFQLQKFDATVYTIDLMVLSILREMGVLITAIMVAGRSGAAFAAQLGTMKLNEEVDALKTMDAAPFDVLVLPRLLAIVVALPLLTIVADAMGLLGGYIFSASYLDYSYAQYLDRAQEAANMHQFYVGLAKAPVFAILIGIVGCMQGLQARGSAEDVGHKTITAVVQSIFLVIVADALFSIVFTKLGI
jgi:phospholipid/cholesterol/gamma-HCH transport system permease protein